MKYTIRKSIIQIIGNIWMPAILCAQEKTLSSSDVENLRDDDGKVTRESVEQWLTCHSGDFQSVKDFSASIEDGAGTIDIAWADPESEFTYMDITCPCEV